ncbi:MAG: dephospho-CoA kinase [Candidatus Margulisbacteria bacterium]|nr:dephospho-CoA kinase [Candidatus Margulisiibacteriota bacterium]
MKIIGLTGPIGAGKNVAAKILARRKTAVIDADKLAHTLYKEQSPVWRKLVKAFGSKILNRGGKINRKKLGEIVFSDKRKLKQLNAIIHPHLKKLVLNQINLVVVGWQLVVINAAVLEEIGLIPHVDKVWVVMASKDTRLKRLVKSGMSRKEAKLRIDAQVSQKEYFRIADVVIRNNGTLNSLKKQVLALLSN